MSTVHVLDITDTNANVETRAGFGVLDMSAGTGAGIVAAAALLDTLEDTSGKTRGTAGEARAWRRLRGMAAYSTNPAVANAVMRAYPCKAAREAGAVASGIDRAFLARIGRDMQAAFRDGRGFHLTVNDGGQERTLAFVPDGAMKRLSAIEGPQDVPTKVRRAARLIGPGE